MLQAANGAEAVDLARGRDGTIDLVITDMVMPVMSGQELARHLAELRPGVRILYMSAFASNIYSPARWPMRWPTTSPSPSISTRSCDKVRELLARPPRAVS